MSWRMNDRMNEQMNELMNKYKCPQEGLMVVFLSFYLFRDCPALGIGQHWHSTGFSC